MALLAAAKEKKGGALIFLRCDHKAALHNAHSHAGACGEARLL